MSAMFEGSKPMAASFLKRSAVRLARMALSQNLRCTTLVYIVYLIFFVEYPYGQRGLISEPQKILIQSKKNTPAMTGVVDVAGLAVVAFLDGLLEFSKNFYNLNSDFGSQLIFGSYFL